MIDINSEVRAITIRQPFAGLMLGGKIETRRWSTPYRGPVLICVSKKDYTLPELYEICTDKQVGDNLAYLFDNKIPFNNGMAICIGDLVDCRPMRKSDEAKACVQHNTSLYSHVYDNIREITPFAFRGRPGWTILSYEQKQQVFKSLIK